MTKRSILKVDRNPIGITQFGIDPFENKVIHPRKGKCIRDYEGIETYEFDKPLLKCNSLRLNHRNRLISFWTTNDSSNYILYQRINGNDIPKYLIVIGEGGKCDLFKIDSDGKFEKYYDSYTDKTFHNKINGDSNTYKIPNDLSWDEYRFLMNIIQFSKINFRRVKVYLHYSNFGFSIQNHYYIHKYSNLFYKYTKVNILGYSFYVPSYCHYDCTCVLKPHKTFENGLELYIGDHNLYYTLSEKKLSKIINKFEEKFGINIYPEDINKNVINYHCDHTLENIKDYKRIYKRILGKLNRELMYKINEKVINEKIEEFVNNHGDIKVTLEDSLAVGNCEYGTKSFGKKYGFDENNLPTVKQLYNIMKEDWYYSDNIRLVLIYVMNKIEGDSED